MNEEKIENEWEKTSKKIDQINDQLNHARKNNFKKSMVHALEVELAKYSGILDGLAFAINS